MQKGISYTTILHEPRIKAGLTCNQYVLASTIFHMQNNQEFPGWCYATKEWFAEMIGVSKQSIINLIGQLCELGFVVKSQNGRHLQITKKWSDEIEKFDFGKESLPSQENKTVKKVYQNGKESLPNLVKKVYQETVKKVYPIIIEESNSKTIDNDIAPNGAPPKKPKKEKLSKDGNLIKSMASDFDVAFSYLSGTSKNLQWGAAATEKIRWSGKEIGNIANLRDALQKRMKEKQVDPTDKDTLENWRMFLQMSIDLKDDFLNRNFTPSFLYSQFNSIVLKLNQKKNGKQSSTGPTIISESTKRDAIRELFEEGYFDNGNKH